MLYTKVFNQFKEGYLGYATLGLLIQSCLGGIAAMAILHERTGFSQQIQLFMAVVLCMMYNASMMAGFNKKWVFNLLLASLLLNSIFISLAILV